MKVLMMVGLAALVGCRTIKTTNKASRLLKKDVQLNTAAVGTALKETSTVTYWPDGKVYQFQTVKEQLEATELSRLNVEEKESAQVSEVRKERMPLKVWLYAGLAVLLAGSLLLYRKLR